MTLLFCNQTLCRLLTQQLGSVRQTNYTDKTSPRGRRQESIGGAFYYPVGNVGLLYTEGVEQAKKYVFNSGQLTTRFLKPKLGDSAGVFGAAML